MSSRRCDGTQFQDSDLLEEGRTFWDSATFIFMYSDLPNKRAPPNKQAGLDIRSKFSEKSSLKTKKMLKMLICLCFRKLRWTKLTVLAVLRSLYVSSCVWDSSKPSLEIRTANATFWNSFGLFRDYGLDYIFVGIFLFYFLR